MREQSYLILLAYAPEALYGYGIIAAVRELADGRVKLGAGTLDRSAADGLVDIDHEEVVDGRSSCAPTAATYASCRTPNVTARPPSTTATAMPNTRRGPDVRLAYTTAANRYSRQKF